MTERRINKRFNLTDHPQVLDSSSNKLIGKMLDISEDGFKMITLDKLEQGEEYTFNITLPFANKREKVVNVKARVQWCVKEVGPELSTLGCYLVQIDVLGKFNIANFIFDTLQR